MPSPVETIEKRQKRRQGLTLVPKGIPTMAFSCFEFVSPQGVPIIAWDPTNSVPYFPTLPAVTLTGTQTITGAIVSTTTITAGTSLAATTSATVGTTLVVGSTISAGGKVFPASNDGGALGDTSHNFSDLFLATGGVVNYANGDAVLTHSTGILTLGTGELRVTTPGTNSASVPTLGSASTFTSKTLTAPVINGATSASGNFDLSGSTGTFLTSTGAVSIGGTATFAANKNLLCAAGTSALDFSLGTGITKTTTGVNSFKGSAHNFDAVLQPTTNDAAALGTTTLGFADLFLATGGTLHFANTDWVATHTTGILTVGTGDVRVTTAGTNTASVVTVGGTQTLAAKTFTAPVIGAASGTSLVLTGGVRFTPTVYTSDGAITLASGTHLIEKTSAAAMTVAAPSSQDGERLEIISNTDFAHVVTFSGSTLMDGTTGANLTVTMTAFKGSAITVEARGTKWLLVGSSNVTSITV